MNEQETGTIPFSRRYGIIPACDVANLATLTSILRATANLPFIQGYKIGIELVLAYGAAKICRTIRAQTDKPIIYDHQKFGTDIPEICGGPVLDVLAKSGVGAVIIFPLAGPYTLQSAVEGCWKRHLAPIVGGDMTHKGFLDTEGGYICSDAPSRIFADAAAHGVTMFVFPGTRPERLKSYRLLVEQRVAQPRYLLPGIGRGQGGDIVAAFQAVAPHSAYAIVGRGIYAETDPREAATRLWQGVIDHGLNK